MEIVRAETRHIPGMLRLLGQVGQVHHVGRPDLFRDGAIKYSAQELEALLEDENSPIFIAEDADVLGYCFCQCQTVEGNACILGRKELYIDDLCVEETARGQHIGSALYRYTVDWAKQRGFDYITLRVWDFPGSAEDFYRNLGMKSRYLCMEQKLEDI